MKPTQVQRLSECSSDAVAFTTIGEALDPYVTARFTVDGDPVTKSRARWNSRQGHAYTPAKTVAAERQVLAEYLKVANASDRKDSKHTFGLAAVFFLRPGLVRRDVDNMIKLVCDALNGWAWKDDSQVTEVIGRKVTAVPADASRTEIVIYRTGLIVDDRPTVICRGCAKVFHVSASLADATKFCSADCRTAYRRSTRSRKCKHCGSEFQAPAPTSDQSYCSNKCKNDASKIDVSCANCGVAFRKAKSLNRRGNSYCSDECKATYWRNHRKSRAAGTCQDCGGATTKKSYKRCRDCMYAAGGRWADHSKDDL